jgi:hypothetical protein
MRTCPTLHAVALPAVIAGTLATGCTTTTETFPGKSRDQVWTALLRAAETPQYKDWHVIENDVWGYESDGRIEIWRLLRRYTDPPGQWARMEDREWKFAVMLDQADPPSATFKVRSMGVPSYGWDEGDLYFAHVWTLLGGKPEPGSPPPTPAPKSGAPVTTSESPTPATEAPAQQPSPAAPEPATSPVDVPNS